jgi:hypothetical protein
MRKFVLSVAALAAFVGFGLAASVTFVKWDAAKNELTVKDGDKESTYKVTEKTKVKMGDKDGDIEKVKGMWDKAGDKMAGKKMDITVDGKEVSEIKIMGGKKKDK